MLSGVLRVTFFVGDLVLLNVSMFLSLYLFGERSASASGLIYLFVFSNLAWLFLVMVSAPYQVHKGWTASKIIKNQLAFVFIHLMVIGSLVIFFRQSYTIFEIAFIYLLFIPTLVLLRIVVLYLRRMSGKETALKRFVLIGKNDISEGIRRFFLTHPEEGYRFVTYFEFEKGEIPMQRIRTFCAANDIQELFFCMPEVDQVQLRELIDFGLDSLIKVKVMTQIGMGQTESLIMNRVDALPSFSRGASPLDDTVNQIVKRIFDFIFSLTFTVTVLSWLLPLIGIAIMIDSRGPIFFVQLRSGINNKPFRCLKLRTMVVNKQADTLQATKDDKRITKLGHFLRKTSIDELPQFLNVLTGSMSVVGPRPHMLLHTDEYAKHIEKFMGRHYVKPGVTGLAQCLGYRGETRDLADMENRVRMDRYYIDNWSFWLDIKIIFLTIISLIRGSEKAY